LGAISSRLSSRLPGYTGSHPRDQRRALVDPKGHLRFFVSLDELEELVEYAIGSYHSTPHAGLNNVTPLEAIVYFVRAYLDKGVRPHINLHGARYTSDVLAWDLVRIAGSADIIINMDTLLIGQDSIPDVGHFDVLELESADVELSLANAMHQLDA
jgi:putative transposase